jgi:hypothetical protein
MVKWHLDWALVDSESRSHNIRWGIRRGFETGNSKFYNCKCYGYINASEMSRLNFIISMINNVNSYFCF